MPSVGNYFCKVMHFGLKTVGVTYQRLINKTFAKHIRALMEVYIDDMLVKTKVEKEFLPNLETVIGYLRRHRMKLNPHKCIFAVDARKFLGFMLIHRGIEANPDKCKAILEMKSPSFVKDASTRWGE